MDGERLKDANILMDDKPLFGIWLHGVGWLKAKDTLTFTSLVVAEQVAQRIGAGAKVFYIDTSLEDLESKLLEAERRKKQRSLWHIFKKLLRINKSN